MNEAVSTLRRARTAAPLLAACLLLGAAACGTKTDGTRQGAGPTADTTEAMESLTLVDLAVADTALSTLVAALQRTGLAQTLQGPGPFTVFAPTNAAFVALSDAPLDDLTDGELTNILAYHVVGERLAAADLAGRATLLTTQGSDLAVTAGADGSIRVNDATLVVRDVAAANGVLHVIDAVLIPPDDDAL